ncbi:MAG TPA: sigma-70 family RNA polymerase sigma factor [Terriglobia bacterium]|nr:sigma-70 family RNA polymerase sigma factor [Terriglobia bacterium]
MPTSDRDLIDSCLAGEQAAWTQLITRYQRLIYSVARKLCSQPEDCADVFQRVCLDLYQNLKQLRNDRTLPAWLITVTRRRSFASIREKRAEVSIEDYLSESDPHVDAVEQEFLLERAVAELPDRCESLIRLLYFDANEPTYADISDRLGIPVASIGPTRARCLEKLRKMLER